MKKPKTPRAGASSAPRSGSTYDEVEDGLLAYLDGFNDADRLERIDDFLHRLNFERRLTALTPEQRHNMTDRSLSPEARAKLDAAKTKAEREELITMYARSTYFRECAWTDYLNNGGTPPLSNIPLCVNTATGGKGIK